MLRNYMTPPPLEQINIFAIKHDGTITLLTDQKSREAFFYAQLPAVKTEVQARIVATSWLRLQQEFVRKLYLQPSFTITPADFRVTIIQTYPEKLEVTGKAIVTPGTQITGEISVKLLFANDGKLQRVTEEQHVEFPLIPPPP